MMSKYFERNRLTMLDCFKQRVLKLGLSTNLIHESEMQIFTCVIQRDKLLLNSFQFINSRHTTDHTTMLQFYHSNISISSLNKVNSEKN